MSCDPSPIRVLSVDDHALLREGIAALVNAESDMKLVAEASDGQEAIDKFLVHRPDVTLMDLQMPAPERHRGNYQDSKRIPQCPHHCPNDVHRPYSCCAPLKLVPGLTY